MEALSKAKVKFFTSLQRKKNRYEAKQFLVEGVKMFQEAYHSQWEIEAIIFQQDKMDQFGEIIKLIPSYKCWYVSPPHFRQISELQHPEGILTILKFPDFFQGKSLAANELVINSLKPALLLEHIQDPGNLGTLMRTADWFGKADIFCSRDTVDILNAKALRATMGAIFRVNIYYISQWHAFIKKYRDRIWIADLSGTHIGDTDMQKGDWILLGNEANGIQEETLNISGIRRLVIPGRGHAESLNVGISGGICLYHLSQLNN